MELKRSSSGKKLEPNSQNFFLKILKSRLFLLFIMIGLLIPLSFYFENGLKEIFKKFKNTKVPSEKKIKKLCYVDCENDFKGDFPNGTVFSPPYLTVQLNSYLYSKICKDNQECYCKNGEKDLINTLGKETYFEYRESYKKLCKGYILN